MVLHIARWDRLKDAVGLMRGFAAHVLNEVDAHLIVAGPAIGAVADDPESATVYEEVLGEWRALPDLERSRIQIACLPLDDVDENAMIVNGLLQHASVVVKKSLEEGFGLGATEALWKCKPVVAARVGGLPDQVEHGRTGVLLDDPTDGAALGEAVCELLGDDALARSLGQAGHRRVRERFLIDRHLAEWLELLPDAVRRYSAATRRPARAL